MLSWASPSLVKRTGTTHPTVTQAIRKLVKTPLATAFAVPLGQLALQRVSIGDKVSLGVAQRGQWKA